MSTDTPTTPYDPDLLILDGGLATELEQRGHDLNHPLWSARILLSAPNAIREVHEAYLDAGADIITTATYQASFPGLQKEGLSTHDALDVFELAVDLAVQAKNQFASPLRQPLVAASIGPYGAYRADGSEYVGQYDRSEEQLLDFHQDRFEILADSRADLLACETIPSLPETRALATLIQDHPENLAWVSFTCRDGKHISDGTPITQCARLLNPIPNVIALGVNCTPPHLVPNLINQLRPATTKPLIIYPNSGEQYDPKSRSWHGDGSPEAYADNAEAWAQAGATIIGGCCRTTPHHIKQLTKSLIHRTPTPIPNS
ncbi:MAG: homocysteine S-methyltransferase [Verrucomicrobiota bacterium]